MKMSTTSTTNTATNNNNGSTSSVAVLLAGGGISNFSPARFTKEEKSVLFELFRENEEIIDIKHRRNSSKKNISVRECWDRIVAQYNDNPDITTLRNVKQLQKFWLNSRLRKHYPSVSSAGGGGGGGGGGGKINNNKTPAKNKGKIINKFETINLQEYADNIKYEKECETEDIEMLEQEVDQLQEEDKSENSTSSTEVILDETGEQYNIDHISADKLTLNDLLEFKSSRPRDEIVLTLKTADNLTLANLKSGTTTAINPLQQQTYTTTSYRIASTNSGAAIVTEQYPIIQQQPTIQQQPAIQQQQVITQHHHQQQPQQILSSTPPKLHHNKSSTAQISICRPDLNNTTMASINDTAHNISSNNRNSIDNLSITTPRSPTIVDNYEEKIVFYRLKEAELKYKEEQLKWEQSKIELEHAKEKLKHAKELHAYEIEEIKLKLKFLNEKDNKAKVMVDKIHKK